MRIHDMQGSGWECVGRAWADLGEAGLAGVLPDDAAAQGLRDAGQLCLKQHGREGSHRHAH